MAIQGWRQRVHEAVRLKELRVTHLVSVEDRVARYDLEVGHDAVLPMSHLKVAFVNDPDVLLLLPSGRVVVRHPDT